MSAYRKFWESVNYGEQGDVEGLIWQKENGRWVMLIGDPQFNGRLIPVSVQYNPWTGKPLSDVIESPEETLERGRELLGTDCREEL